MKPPACVRNKWGSGTTCERPPDTIAAKEVKSNFEKMMAERIKQDAAWFAPPRGASLFATKDDQTRPVSSVSNDLGTTKK
jgi:hypothetical protein